MHSVGRSSEPGDPMRGSVAQADPMVAPPQLGNGVLAPMAAAAEPSVAPIAIARPASAAPSVDDPSFNPVTRAHNLLRVIDSGPYAFAMKGSDTPVGGMTAGVAKAGRRLNDLLDILADRTGRNP